MHTGSLIIATRESPLALWQANWVKSALEQHYPGLTVSLLGMTTQADRQAYISLQEIGGKGLFVKELEEALLDGRADLAVHSLKDMPVDSPPGLCLAAMSAREEPLDAFVANAYADWRDLPAGAIVGTSSLRRQSQLLHWRPDIETRPLRGNVNTRLAKLDQGEYAAVILAAAGLRRLGMTERLRCVLPATVFLPAAAQGILAIQCREDATALRATLAVLNDADSALCAEAERAISRRLGANCQVPVAAFALRQQNELWVRGLVSNRQGTVMLRAERTGPLTSARALGEAVGDDLLAQGAAAVLQSCLR